MLPGVSEHKNPWRRHLMNEANEKLRALRALEFYLKYHFLWREEAWIWPELKGHLYRFQLCEAWRLTHLLMPHRTVEWKVPTHTGAARGKCDNESSQHVPGLRNINLVARKKYILQAAKSIVLGGALNKSSVSKYSHQDKVFIICWRTKKWGIWGRRWFYILFYFINFINLI